MSNCNHIIGTLECDYQTTIVASDHAPDCYGLDEPFLFCPRCGVDVTQEAAIFQHSCDAVRAQKRLDFEARMEAAKLAPLEVRKPATTEEYFQTEAARIFPPKK